MAWLQSSFTSHQLLSDSTSNKKGPKGAGVSKYSSSDKSHTPLLEDTSHSPENEASSDDWLKKSSPSVESKPVPPCNSSKSSFLSHSFFDKSSKGKNMTNPNSTNTSKSSSENKGLLSKENSKKNILFNDDSDEADSDEEWCVPRMGQYQRVKSAADF